MNSTPPFSRAYPVSSLHDNASQIAITATPGECAALAREDGLVAIAGLEADFRAKREGRTGVIITGEVRACVTQTCVLSFEPFETQIKALVEARFDSVSPADGVAFGVEDRDPPDLIVDGKIDLGALAAEFLALELDPYPRKPDAVFEGLQLERQSPFAGLKDKIANKSPKK